MLILQPFYAFNFSALNNQKQKEILYPFSMNNMCGKKGHWKDAADANCQGRKREKRGLGSLISKDIWSYRLHHMLGISYVDFTRTLSR